MVIVVQINVGGFDKNFSYLVYGSNKHALLIDATGSKNAIEKEIRERGLILVAQILTHTHFDHVENVGYFLGKNVPLITFEELKAEPGFIVDDFVVKILFTPGHSTDSICILIENNLFSGDTLFVKGVGRTDLEGGSEKELNESLEKISALPPETILYPGHNYGGEKSSLKDALNLCDCRPSPEKLKQIEKKKADYKKLFKEKNQSHSHDSEQNKE